MSVEFKLFGELTLKQFLYVGGAGAISYMILASDMALPLKIFLTLLISGSGAALALIPINNRPLEVWVGNFLLALANPTKRVWKKGENPNIPKTIYSMEQYNKEVAIQPSVSAPQLATAQVAPQTQTAVLPYTPAPTVAPTQKLISTASANTPYQSTTPVPERPVQEQTSLLSQANNTKIEPTMTQTKNSDNLQKVIGENAATTPTAPKSRPTFVLDIAKLSEHTAALPGYTPKPNIIKGVVKDKAGSLIAGAIVIIKRKETNQPARAMVTNPLGEFETTSPLETGTFIIDISHSDKEMPLYELVLDTTPVPPLQFQFTA